MASIVIPAHNEEGVIGRLLRPLVENAEPGELEVVVACNGCTDRTAEVAAGFPGVRVLDLSQPSKAAALNEGDRAASRFPRIYLDADVRVDLASVRATASALRAGALAATPPLRVDLSAASRPVRAYYAVWTRLLARRGEYLGSGFYGLSEDGRRRFSEFPAIVADDLFVRELFAPQERTLVEPGVFTITPPPTLRALVDVRTRVQAGNVQLAEASPELEVDRSPGRGGGLAAVVREEPRLAGPAVVDFAVQVAARLRARWRNRFGNVNRWDRDSASRSVA
jgi:glycosyltransferase involved in cell wall biosynthesis